MAAPCLAALLLFAPAPVTAQSAPDAGTVLRDVERNAPILTRPPLEAPPLPAEPEVPLLKQGQTVLVRDFRIHATFYPEGVLKDLLKDYVGRECSLGDLEEAARRIGRFYRENDRLARAYLPRQAIRDGIVEIIVLEGRLGRVIIDPSSASRLDADLAAGMVAGRAEPGQPLRPSELQEGVAVLNELPGVSASTTLTPGAAEGLTDAVVRLDDGPLLAGGVQLDNHGVRSLGTRRGTASASLNDPLGQQVALMAMRSSGSAFGRLAVAAPVPVTGLVLGINASVLKYDVGGTLAALEQQGRAWTAGGTAAYPLRRSERLSLTLQAAFDHKRLIDEAMGDNQDNKEINVGTLTLSGSAADAWLGGGITGLSLSGTLGSLDLGRNTVHQAGDRLTAGTEGRYGKFGLSGTRSQTVTEGVELFAALSAQAALGNLDSSEKLSLGGPNGVRAYPVNEANGDQGALASLEIRYRPIDSVRLFGFYDAGGIMQHKDPWANWRTVEGQPNEYALHGTGVGIAWTPMADIQIKASAARPLGNNPGADAQGHDSDGRPARTLRSAGNILTITLPSATKTYGSANPDLGTPSYSGFVHGDTAAAVSGLTFQTTATSSSGVGSYAVRGSGAKATPSAGLTAPYYRTYETGAYVGAYQIAYVAGTLSVTPAALTISTNNASRTYGAANAFTASYSGFVNGDTATSLAAQPTFSTAATSASGVGTYAVTATGAASPNYTISYVGGTLTVTPAALTVTANNAAKTYGAANPALSVSYSGFVNGDTAASLNSAPTVSTTATSGLGVGSYAIDVSGAASPNYTITQVSASNATKTYGAANPALSVSYAGFVNGDTVASLTTGATATTAAPSVGVGTYAISPGGASASNYVFNYASGTLTVTPAALTITANNASRPYGAANSFTASYSGLVNGDTPASLTAGPSFITAATATSGVSSYAVTPTGAASSNYAISYVGGTLTVTPAALTITANNASMIAGGTMPALGISYSGFVNGESEADLVALPGVATSARQGSPTGSYDVTATGAASPNYAITYVPGILTVSPAPVARPSELNAGQMLATLPQNGQVATGPQHSVDERFHVTAPVPAISPVYQRVTVSAEAISGPGGTSNHQQEGDR